MKFPDLAYINWAQSLPRVDINLARSGVDLCPVSMLGLKASDLVATLPVRHGYAPLGDAIARRYGVTAGQVFAVSGGTSFANWLACAAVLDGYGHGGEVIVERPTYEPLLRIPQALGHRVRRIERRFEDDYAFDLDRFASLVTTKTRLAIVSNLHNPSGARIPMPRCARWRAARAREGVPARRRGLSGASSGTGRVASMRTECRRPTA
jgi:DNA-binding transcriptional MocR family regulator